MRFSVLPCTELHKTILVLAVIVLVMVLAVIVKVLVMVLAVIVKVLVMVLAVIVGSRCRDGRRVDRTYNEGKHELEFLRIVFLPNSKFNKFKIQELEENMPFLIPRFYFMKLHL